MENRDKKLVITIINVIIFVCNAIISFIGNGGDVSAVATVGDTLLTGGALLTGMALV